jgi:hypothetical protein
MSGDYPLTRALYERRAELEYLLAQTLAREAAVYGAAFALSLSHVGPRADSAALAHQDGEEAVRLFRSL